MTFSYMLRRSALHACLLLACFAFTTQLAGCPKPMIGGDQGQMQPVVKIDPLEEARAAYHKSDFTLAETIALRLTRDSSTAKTGLVEANRLLAAAALKNRHPSLALDALDQWRKLEPHADMLEEWQDAWCRAARSLSSHDARTRADSLYQDSSRDPLVRSAIGVFLAVRQWRDGDVGQTMAALENIHASADSTKSRAALERRLALELHFANASTAALALGAVTEDNQGKFPYSIIRIDSLRRDLLRKGLREEALAALAALQNAISLSDPSLFGALPTESEIRIQGPTATLTPGKPITGQPVVLALPLSGQYAAISAKIQAGAQIACDELSASGNPVSLVVVDTEQPNWVAQIDALPANASVVGGPLRRTDYSKAKAQGLTSRRVVLSFLPGLEPGDEGNTAWRFFASAQDQVDALLSLSSRLGIRGYGVLYPQESFGQRMSALFEERAKALGAGTVVTRSYTPGDQNSWMASVADLLGTNKSGNAFKAIFLPDSWKNMDVIVPNIFYQNETRQVLMGTSLWEQGLTGTSFVSTQYYGLAVFPGNWSSSQPGPAGQRLQSALQAAGKEQADFWTGLGYDFTRLSSRLGIGQGWDSRQVNAALQNANMDWSIAPIHWNNGLAAQQMRLFTPEASGFKPVDEAEFRAAFEDAWR